MTDFELLSRVFALLLGLAIAEVLRGFARVLRIVHSIDGPQYEAIRIGWLVPLLGGLMTIDQATFWFNFNELGPNLPSGPLGMLGLMIVIGAYYVLSTFVFPQQPENWPDFDDYYMRVRRTVIGGMLAVNVFGFAYLALLVAVGSRIGSGPDTLDTPFSDAADLLGILLLVVLLFVRSRRGNLVLLTLATLLTMASILPF